MGDARLCPAMTEFLDFIFDQGLIDILLSGGIQRGQIIGSSPIGLRWTLSPLDLPIWLFVGIIAGQGQGSTCSGKMAQAKV
jgi:hypothetical protein